MADRTRLRRRALSAFDALERYVRERDYAGFDPYDALNSPLLRWASARSRMLRIAFIQTLRRLPMNSRPLLGIAPGHNPKALGLFLWGYARAFARTQDPSTLKAIDHLLALLSRMRSTSASGYAWGYNFDWQSRAFFVPRGVPTVVNTSFIGHALLDAWELAGRNDALELAARTVPFYQFDLNRTRDGAAFCFSYTPLDHTAIHNANLLGASFLARLSRATGEERLLDDALSSVAFTMARQHADGSWYYADTSFQNWIDSFHTGFNLQALRYVLASGRAEEHRAAYEKGVAYYASRFFLEDGTPKYYSDRVPPIDIHSPAQAIAFFAAEPAYEEFTDNVLAWMLDHMYDPQRGYFFFRRGPFLTNRIPYMRWAQAWAFHALSEYCLRQAERSR